MHTILNRYDGGELLRIVSFILSPTEPDNTELAFLDSDEMTALIYDGVSKDTVKIIDAQDALLFLNGKEKVVFRIQKDTAGFSALLMC